ncbi:MAG: glutathione S-transferase N-terminal domain-containing protein, partial [Pseudomonadota bacterium]|nr:glutathione S-transferase N-terminal domain-containing protein [Pseudomonadota bacterium]
MKVDVYGADHSPWVQAVLLGLREKGIEPEIHLLPPLAVFRKWGILMPAVSIDGKPWQIDSTKILENFDFDPISDKELRLVQNAWQSVLQRPRNPFRFFAGFARIQNPEPILFKRYVSHFGFSFVCFYMFVLINFIKIIIRPVPPVDYGVQFLYWEQAVADFDGPFLDGASPG